MRANNRITKVQMRKKQAKVAKKAKLNKIIKRVRNIKRNNLSKTRDEELLTLSVREFVEEVEKANEEDDLE